MSAERGAENLPLAVVVGAGAMGMAIARRLGYGRRLLLADIDGERLERERARLADEGYAVAVRCCDLTDAASVQALGEACAALGGWSALAHVAGLSPSMADARTIATVNLAGPALVAQALLPVAAHGGAAAVFIASLAAHTVRPSPEALALLDDPLHAEFAERVLAAMGEAVSPALAYQWSKLGLVRLCRREAAAWGRKGARIVSLSPGLIDTPMGRLEFEAGPQKHALLAKTPLGRQGTMLEIAETVEFLVSDKAAFITGTDLLVDGGVAAAVATS